ncbi:MAG TPA: adenylate/guanylate cyclase domain-containing protein [Methylomirabilota bacterium]|jgi:class 3 adenylate cyclase
MPEGSPSSGSPGLPRRAFSRPPISLALIGLVTLLTLATGATLGALAWREKHAGSRALVDGAMAQAARMTADHTEEFLRHAENTVRLGPSLVARGLLDPNDFRALADYALGVLRVNAQLSWVSYGDRTDRFVGAWTDGADFYLNRSFPRGGRIRLEEDRILPDGRRERVRESNDHGYHPRERAFYRLAEARRDVAWAEPYRFYNGALGITCAMPLLDAAGAVRGVFTVDLSLSGLSRFVSELRVSPRGRVFIAAREGQIVAAPGGVDASGRMQWDDGALVSEVLRNLRESVAGAYAFDHAGERFLGRAASFKVGDREWVTAVVVPERDFTAAIEAQTWRAAGLGLLALLLAVAGGIAVVRWISEPLRELGAQARRIREGDLDVTITPRSRDELGTLARTMAEMVQGLRDRDFIRDTLGRYVSPELAEQCIRDRGALRLGGEIRTVSILMSDLRGFSGLSERLGPEKMIGLLNRYLGCMTPVILRHRGTINEFIGDAILVLFGAPFERPDDAERAVRCAWAMERAMADFNAESQVLGLPSLVMGIAVHSGRVVAGNIGSEDRMKYGVVGPAVNLTGRIESLTLGPQVLLSEATLDRVRHLAQVGPGTRVTVKGVPEPVTVYELQGVTGEERAEAPDEGEAWAAVDLPAVAHIVGDGKRVDETPYPVRVTRIGRAAVELVTSDAAPVSHSDLKLFVDFGDGGATDGSYVRIAAREPSARLGPGGARVRAVFTFLAEADRVCIDRLTDRRAAGTGVDGR